MSVTWHKMDKISDKMRQDGAKMRKMKDVSSVLGPLRAYESRTISNNAASQGPKRAQKSLKMAPREPKRAQRWPQEGPR